MEVVNQDDRKEVPVCVGRCRFITFLLAKFR
jgi:hypothetical protein